MEKQFCGIVCTFFAAVTTAALDSNVGAGAEYGVRGKFPAEDFHTTKKFVLVCRSDPAFEISISFVLAQPKTGSFPL